MSDDEVVASTPAVLFFPFLHFRVQDHLDFDHAMIALQLRMEVYQKPGTDGGSIILGVYTEG